MIQKLERLLLFAALPLLCLSCGRTSETDISSPTEQVQEESVGTTQDTPRFKGNIFCNHYRYGPNSGSTATFGGGGGMTCGHRERAPTDIAWRFLGHRNGKDIYEIEIRSQIDDVTSTTTKREVEFEGVEITLLEDDFKRVRILPGDFEQSDPADDNAAADS